MTTVVTTFGPAGYREYGWRFLETFNQFWPKDVNLLVYVEEPIKCSRGTILKVDDVPECTNFVRRNSNILEHCGRTPVKGWRDKDHRRGYCFRFDAVKFCRMAMIPHHAAREAMMAGDDILVWMDGDVVTTKKIPENFVEDILGDADFAYLGREPYHSETGFVAFRLPNALPLIDGWHSMYATEKVFNLREWHSAFVFDVVRKSCEKNGLKGRNLVPPNGDRRHPWFSCILGQYTDHLKGPRKSLDRSPESRRAR